MNELKIFENKMDELKNLKINAYRGYVYLIELGNGRVKIGSSTAPYRRIKNLKGAVEKYGNTKTGRIAISEQHEAFRENEKTLHQLFKDIRICGTELFLSDFEELIRRINEVCLPLEVREEKSEKVKEAQAEALKHAFATEFERSAVAHPKRLSIKLAEKIVEFTETEIQKRFEKLDVFNTEDFKEAEEKLFFMKIYEKSFACTAMSIDNFVAMLNECDIDIRKETFKNWLIEKGYARFDERCGIMPNDDYFDTGLFAFKNDKIVAVEGWREDRELLITSKGQIYFVNKFMRN